MDTLKILNWAASNEFFRDNSTKKEWMNNNYFCVHFLCQGGLFVLDIVDYFGGGFIIFIMAVVETIGICWIYGITVSGYHY